MSSKAIRIDEDLYAELWDMIDRDHKTISAVIGGLIDREDQMEDPSLCIKHAANKQKDI